MTVIWEVYRQRDWMRIGWVQAMSTDSIETVLAVAKRAYPSCVAPVIYSPFHRPKAFKSQPTEESN